MKTLLDLDKRHLIDIINDLLQFLDDEHMDCHLKYWEIICKDYGLDKNKCWDIPTDFTCPMCVDCPDGCPLDNKMEEK